MGPNKFMSPRKKLLSWYIGLTKTRLESVPTPRV